MSATNEVRTAAKARPITSATARSTMLPRMMKSRNPLTIGVPSHLQLTAIRSAEYTDRSTAATAPPTA